MKPGLGFVISDPRLLLRLLTVTSGIELVSVAGIQGSFRINFSHSDDVDVSAEPIDSDFGEDFAFGFFGFRSDAPLLTHSGNNEAAVSFNSANRCSKAAISSANF